MIKVICLIENTSAFPDIEAEHGLSLYIETGNRKMLVDTGASDKTLKNAKKLGVDISSVDSIILSHGHYDHTGGLIPICNCCTPDIYLRRNASLNYVSLKGEPHYIGINPEILKLPCLHLTGEFTEIDSEISLFSNVKGNRYRPKSNSLLKLKTDDFLKDDTFSHEQNTVIRDGSKYALICGCAHTGILNILDRFYELYGVFPSAVVGGFHMVKSGDYTTEEINTIEATSIELAAHNTVYYTGHCTGDFAFDILKKTLGSRLFRLSSGFEFSIQ